MSHQNNFNPIPEEKDVYHFLRLHPTDAIEKIMDIYGDEIKRLVYTYVKNKADTDDVTQEVFVKIYQNLHTFEGKSSFRTWVYSIAINKTKDYLRSWHIRNRRIKERLQQSARSFSPIENNPEENTIKSDESKWLLNKVMSLPIKYREIIILYYFRELTTKEISEVLHVKEATVRTRLSRGRNQLKHLLQSERGGNLG